MSGGTGTVGSTTPLLSPEEIAVKAGEQVPFLRLPVRSEVFAERALRLRQLAAGHAMRDFLVFMADLADVQHASLSAMPDLALPDDAVLREAARAGKPPLPADAGVGGVGGVGDSAWRAVLHGLLDRLRTRLPAGPALDVAQSLRAADADHLDRQADRLLGGVMLGLNLGTAPLIAAALQVCWTHRVLAVQQRHDAATAATGGRAAPEPFGRIDDATRCPCCGSRPTSSVTRIGADASGFRYLNCSLCSTQWHMVRIKCAHCQSTKGIEYEQLEPADGGAPGSARRPPPATASAAPPAGAVQVEVCGECNHYLKIVHMEKDVHVEAVADDLASVTLDLLVSDAGVQRHGVNLLLLFGDPDPLDAGHLDLDRAADPPAAP